MPSVVLAEATIWGFLFYVGLALAGSLGVLGAIAYTIWRVAQDTRERRNKHQPPLF